MVSVPPTRSQVDPGDRAHELCFLIARTLTLSRCLFYPTTGQMESATCPKNLQFVVDRNAAEPGPAKALNRLRIK